MYMCIYIYIHVYIYIYIYMHINIKQHTESSPITINNKHAALNVLYVPLPLAHFDC